MKRVTIDPLTRLEGHGRVDIFLDDEGEVLEAYLIVPEFRGFEGLCVGRPAEEMPRITNRICGICPEAHHMASSKALDALYQVEPSSAARKVRELDYMTFFVTDHMTHFFALAGPDLFLGPDAPPAERNLLGVLRHLGEAEGRRVLAVRMRNFKILEALGGRAIHPEAGLPGGWSKPVSVPLREEVSAAARENIEFALGCLSLFEKTVLPRPEFRELLLSEVLEDRTYSMGTVDERNRVNFYDGVLRVVDPDGNEFARFHPRDYRRHISEHVESWTYLKFPFLSSVGWKGLTDGPASGVYCATPLARLNVADGMATPRAQEAFERMLDVLGSRKASGRRKPIHSRLAIHWARLIELLYASERMLELAEDPEITDPAVRIVAKTRGGEAVGCVEAPRGTLIHHYWADEQGLLTRVNLVVGTTHNHAPMALSVTRAAKAFIRGGEEVSEGLLNRIEMVVRCYDPCLSCATHTFPGEHGLPVYLRAADGSVLRRIAK